MAETLTGFAAALAEDPEGHATHLVYADWLEDQGRPEAAHWHREIGAGGVLPADLTRAGLRWKRSARVRAKAVLPTWAWLRSRGLLVRLPAELPAELFGLLDGKPVDHLWQPYTVAFYRSKANAWRDLLRAVDRLGRAGCGRGEG